MVWKNALTDFPPENIRIKVSVYDFEKETNTFAVGRFKTCNLTPRYKFHEENHDFEKSFYFSFFPDTEEKVLKEKLKRECVMWTEEINEKITSGIDFLFHFPKHYIFFNSIVGKPTPDGIYFVRYIESNDCHRRMLGEKFWKNFITPHSRRMKESDFNITPVPFLIKNHITYRLYPHKEIHGRFEYREEDGKKFNDFGYPLRMIFLIPMNQHILSVYNAYRSPLGRFKPEESTIVVAQGS